MLNPFTGTGYDLAAMTAAINKLPNLYNRTAAIFRPDPVTTTVVHVEQLNGALNIVRTRPRGASPDVVTADKRELRAFLVPHIPIEDVLLPEEYQNVRAFGTENQAETQANILARKLQKMRNTLDQTQEHLRMGALKGIILDADGTTLYNLYTEFGISQKSVDFELDVDTTEVISKCLAVKRHVEQNLKGESMTGIRCLCSPEFYDALTTHATVKEAFKYYTVLNQNLAEDRRTGFRFGGITFEEYSASWTDKDGNVRKAIEANYGICFPEGTADTFRMVIAPGNFIETANTPGLPYYAKQEQRKFGQGIDIHAESNVLPICLRPEVLVTVSI